MKLSLEDLPVQEQPVYTLITKLPLEQKQTLWRLIQHANKDHICVVPYFTASIASLEQKELISRNYSYRGKGMSYYILRNAPHLMKKLQAFADKPHPLS